jgi:hypothetical protein
MDILITFPAMLSPQHSPGPLSNNTANPIGRNIGKALYLFHLLFGKLRYRIGRVVQIGKLIVSYSLVCRGFLLILFITIMITSIVMNIQAQKAIIIEQFMQVNDIRLINAIKSMLDYALKKEQESLEVPEAHQKLVLERFDKVRKNPERLLDWDEAKKTLKA